MVVLLAIEPSTRKMGWAIFSREPSQQVSDRPKYMEISNQQQENLPLPHHEWKLAKTGVIVAHDRPRRVEVWERIKAIEIELDRMAKTWHPEEVACGKPSHIQLPYQREGAEMLNSTLYEWARVHKLPLFSYPVREIRTAILGRGNGGKEELTYVVMTRWGLLGEGKSTHEWNAIAVGDYHLVQRRMAKVI